MRDIAATVSVAHSTLLTINTSVIVNVLKMKIFNTASISDSKMKPIIVPTTPKKVIIPKF